MKKSFLSFLLLLFAAAAFAGDPIPGVSVKAGTNPGAHDIINTKTGNDGRFTLNLKEGKWDISISYTDVQAAGQHTGKKWDVVTLSLDGGSNMRVLANDKPMPANFTITQSSKAITITVPAGGAAISGVLTGNISKAQIQNATPIKR